MPRALVPLSVAHELPDLVGRLAARLESEALDQLLTLTPASGEFPARTLVAIALADVEHCFQLSEESGCELPARRWEALLAELQRADAQLEYLRLKDTPGSREN